MIRRALGAAATWVLVAAVAGGTASGAAADGPRLAVTRWSLSPEAFEILGTDPLGASAQSIVLGRVKQLPSPIPFGAPSWSPDGSILAFTGVVRVPPRGSHRPASVKIFLVGADGGGLHAVAGTNGGMEPIFSPDGRMLAFSRDRERTRESRHGEEEVVYQSASTWLLDLATGGERQLTPWRNHLLNAPSSFSPDGRLLALSRRVGENRFEALALHLDGSGATVLSRRGFGAVYSPDGSRIVLLRGHRRVVRRRQREGGKVVTQTSAAIATDLFEMRSDGSGLRRLTDTPGIAESEVSWDPSGRRIAYVATEVDGELGFGFGESIVEANADGTCQTPILTDPNFVFFKPVWQPGPGREAGPIPC